MTQSLVELIIRCQQLDLNTQAGQEALVALVDEVLRSPPLCRPFQGEPIQGIYREIDEQVRSRLLVTLPQTLETLDMGSISTDKSENVWKIGQYRQACGDVLTDEVLTELAIATQQTPARSELRQHALGELITAMQLAGYWSASTPASSITEDATQQTFLQIAETIDQFRPEKATVMAWVNFLKKCNLKAAHRSTHDPWAQSAQRRRIKFKSQLRGIFRSAQERGLSDWFWVDLKGLLPTTEQTHQVTGLLVTIWVLAQMQHTQPQQFNQMLDHISIETISAPVRVVPTTETGSAFEPTTPSPESEMSMTEYIRHYFLEDPQQLCQKAIRGRPEVTFQAIALLYLEGKSWQEMSEAFGGIRISSLHTFYTRHLKKIAPEIKAYIEDTYLP